MQLEAERRYDDETLYFDEEGHGELVVAQPDVPEVYPEVTVLEGRDVVATYVNAAGERNTFFKNNEVRLFPGSSVLRIQTGQDTTFAWVGEGDDSKLVYSFETEARDEYVPAEGDVFILKPDNYADEQEWRVHPAIEPLPDTKGSWTIEAVIAADNRLITWGQTGHRQLVEWCLAVQLMETTPDYINLNLSSARSISLLGMFSVNRVVQAYFNELHKRTGADFTPTEEFVQKAERIGIDRGMTEELRARYFPDD